MSKKWATAKSVTPPEPLWVNATGVLLKKGALSDKPAVVGTKPTCIHVANILIVEEDTDFTHEGKPLTVLVLVGGSTVRVTEAPEHFGCPVQPKEETNGEREAERDSGD